MVRVGRGCEVGMGAWGGEGMAWSLVCVGGYACTEQPCMPLPATTLALSITAVRASVSITPDARQPVIVLLRPRRPPVSEPTMRARRSEAAAADTTPCGQRDRRTGPAGQTRRQPQ